MAIHFWRPWIDTYNSGEGAQPERYALRSSGHGGFLAVASSTQLIDRVGDPASAWTFHTHVRAVATAKEISTLYGEPIDVVKLPSG